MTSYDNKYETETELFGMAYSEFDSFLNMRPQPHGRALDVGCGQGRDSILLAKHGYSVVGIDSSSVGVEQMLSQAAALGLDISGIVGDIYDDLPNEQFDVIVLDSILHFQKRDEGKEKSLLAALWSNLCSDGLLIIFVHNTSSKVKKLDQWVKSMSDVGKPIWKEVIDYVYEEKSTKFISKSQMYMLVLEKLR